MIQYTLISKGSDTGGMGEKNNGSNGRGVMMTIGSNPKLYSESEQNVEEEEVEETVPLAPDGGW